MRIEPATPYEKAQRSIGFENGMSLGFILGMLFAGVLATIIFH